jgi:hypothetical protein
MIQIRITRERTVLSCAVMELRTDSRDSSVRVVIGYGLVTGVRFPVGTLIILFAISSRIVIYCA